MAIDKQRRENLLDEATAYCRRVLLRIPIHPAWRRSTSDSGPHRLHLPTDVNAPSDCELYCKLFIGLRNDGGWSLYFDEQPVLQFNSRDELRRLFYGGERYAAAGGRLKWLCQDRSGGKLQLTACELPTAQSPSLTHDCGEWLSIAADLLQSGEYQLLGQYPEPDREWIISLAERLRRVAGQLNIAQSANAC